MDFDETGIDDIWWKHKDNKKDKHINEELFRREYFGEFPRQTFLEWVEDLVNQLDDVEEPNHKYTNDIEYFKRVGAYETQKIICEKLKYAVNYEKFRLEREDKQQ